jgi:Icc-related predicted phosphoesterase
MKLVFISDTHCQLDKITVPDGDVLIHCGDALSSGSESEFKEFIKQFKKLPHKHKIYVPGNHDRYTELSEQNAKDIIFDNDLIMLIDQEIVIDGVKFYGSPVTPRFGHNWAWNRDISINGKQPISDHWDLIPEDTDVLITHGPPHGIMDISVYQGNKCGCPHLLEAVYKVKPKIHAFGHIHNWHGVKVYDDITFINASNCTEQYKPDFKPIVIDI